MLAVLIPVGIVVIIARWSNGTTSRTVAREVTPDHRDVFLRAMHSRSPTAILTVARAFDAQAYDASYSQRLQARARLPARSSAWRLQAEAVFRKALLSDNPEAVQAVATAFASQGLTNASRMLFELARGLELSQELSEVEMQLEEPEEGTSELPQSEAIAVEPEPEPEVKTRIADEGSTP